ncbi:MAG: type II toxin-antitoxin system HicB family antitoxin [Acidobacteria bacterium]|nr:type II toxin-antitoxin system HicB family antitoxin [Acidobacteriota bacterium]
MHQRLNITLPERTIRLMDRIVRKGNRSRFISEAIHRLVEAEGRAKLRLRLKEGAKKRAKRDLELAEEWFGLEEEATPRGRA